MKKTLYFIALVGIVFLMSCKKEKPTGSSSSTATVRYEFTTDRVGNFSVEYSTDSIQGSEMITSPGWVKTVTISRGNTESNTIHLTVHPPFEWTNTSDQANVTIAVYVDGRLKVSNSGVLGGLDHPAGLTVSTEL